MKFLGFSRLVLNDCRERVISNYAKSPHQAASTKLGGHGLISMLSRNFSVTGLSVPARVGFAIQTLFHLCCLLGNQLGVVGLDKSCSMHSQRPACAACPLHFSARVSGLAVMLHVVRMEVMSRFTRPGGLMYLQATAREDPDFAFGIGWRPCLPLSALQDVVQLEANVIDLRIPWVESIRHGKQERLDEMTDDPIYSRTRLTPPFCCL